LVSLHEQRVIVKDLKPANVLVEHAAGGTVRLVIADFGISSLAGATTTAGGGMQGTPNFMSPEQFDRDTFGSVRATHRGCSLLQPSTSRGGRLRFSTDRISVHLARFCAAAGVC
jgi:serine/threonine protein kinase